MWSHSRYKLQAKTSETKKAMFPFGRCQGHNIRNIDYLHRLFMKSNCHSCFQPIDFFYRLSHFLCMLNGFSEPFVCGVCLFSVICMRFARIQALNYSWICWKSHYGFLCVWVCICILTRIKLLCFTHRTTATSAVEEETTTRVAFRIHYDFVYVYSKNMSERICIILPGSWCISNFKI